MSKRSGLIMYFPTLSQSDSHIPGEIAQSSGKAHGRVLFAPDDVICLIAFSIQIICSQMRKEQISPRDTKKREDIYNRLLSPNSEKMKIWLIAIFPIQRGKIRSKKYL